VGAGPATELAPAKEWYTIVVYEKPRSKTVVLYVGRKTFTFKVPASINVGNIAVVMKRWRVSDKTVACSARIHVANLAKLLRAYAPEVAEALEPILHAAEARVDVVARADGARPEAAAERKPRVIEEVDVVVYERPNVKTVEVHIDNDTFTFNVPASCKVNGVVKKASTEGGAKVYYMRVRARDIAELIRKYAYDKATRKISLLDPLFRAAALQGLKVHHNELYVKLWLEHELGEPLFRVGDPRERELGSCIKHFTHSYRIWRMVTPPWAALC
jgi:Arc/MetJ family transcription regulator